MCRNWRNTAEIINKSNYEGQENNHHGILLLTAKEIGCVLISLPWVEEMATTTTQYGVQVEVAVLLKEGSTYKRRSQRLQRAVSFLLFKKKTVLD